jgi:hypothetical protein
MGRFIRYHPVTITSYQHLYFQKFYSLKNCSDICGNSNERFNDHELYFEPDREEVLSYSKAVFSGICPESHVKPLPK